MSFHRPVGPAEADALGRQIALLRSINPTAAVASAVGLWLAWGAALVLHALALDRVWLCLVSGLVIAGLHLGSAGRGRAGVEWSLWRVLTAGGLGALLGWLLPIEVSTSGPLSPTVLSLLTGGVIGAGTWGVATGRALPTGLCALGLATLSGQVFPGLTVARAFDLFVLAWVLLGLAWSGAGRTMLRRQGVAGLVGALMTLMIAGWLTVQFEQKVRDWEEPFLGWLQGWLVEQPDRGSGGASRDLVLAPRGQLDLSERPVFELSRRPERVRTRVYDQYDGTRFSTSAELRTLLRPVSELADPGVTSRELDFVACDSSPGQIPAPAGTWGAEGFGPRMDGGQVLSTSTPALSGRLKYDPREWLLPEPPPGSDLTSVPAHLAESLATLAGEILRDETDPRTQAERLEQHFHQAFRYSLETDLAGPEHPLLVLLRERRPASCTYFAAAYTLLLRARGVPARVVTGYLSPPANRLTAGVTLREADAHAWSEVYIPREERWVGFDPTPGESRSVALAPVQTQGWWDEVWRAGATVARRCWLAVRRDPLGATARAVVWPAGGLLLGWLTWRVGARWLPRRRRSSAQAGLEADDPQLRACRREFEASLTRLGLSWNPAESDEERLLRLKAVASPEQWNRAGRFLAAYHAARFGGLAPSAELLQGARLD